MASLWLSVYLVLCWALHRLILYTITVPYKLLWSRCPPPPVLLLSPLLLCLNRSLSRNWVGSPPLPPLLLPFLLPLLLSLFPLFFSLPSLPQEGLIKNLGWRNVVSFLTLQGMYTQKMNLNGDCLYNPFSPCFPKKSSKTEAVGMRFFSFQNSKLRRHQRLQ